MSLFKAAWPVKTSKNDDRQINRQTGTHARTHADNNRE